MRLPAPGEGPSTLASMRPIRAIAGAVILAVALSGCGGGGGDEGIPPEVAEEMIASVETVEEAVRMQDCDLAQAETTALRRQVDALPEDTDPEIRDGLDEMVSRLDEQLDEECVEAGPTGPTIEEAEPVVPTEPAPAPEPEPEPEEEEEKEEDSVPKQPPGEGGGSQGPRPPQSGGQAPTGGTDTEETAGPSPRRPRAIGT